MKIEKSGSAFTGELCKGCISCKEGKKLVLFITGKCSHDCYYCPINKEHKGRSVTLANEELVKCDEDLLREARAMKARGAGITGGEPLLELNKVIHYIKLLKKEFGQSFHTHLYTNSSLSYDDALKLKNAGLDEIRFHLLSDFDRVKPAIKAGLYVGVEVPVIPGYIDYNELIDYCRSNGVNFINLNEFEMSESNAEELVNKGFRQVNELTYAVIGSKELAMELVECGERLGLRTHFCSVTYKNRYQITKRLLRKARNIKKPYEEVTPDGLLVKGVIEGDISSLDKIHAELKDSAIVKGRLEASVRDAKKYGKKHGLRSYRVMQYPISEAWDFEKEEL